MGRDVPDGERDLQQQLAELRAQGLRDREDIDALLGRADEAELRADDSDSRADQAQDRSKTGEAQTPNYAGRLADLETRVEINEKVIAELQREGLLNHDHALHLQEALRTSRMIGAAIGMLMATEKVSEVEAFAILSRASQTTNRKVRVLADEVVSSGDVSGLTSA